MGVDPVSIGLAALSGLSSVAGSVAQKRQAQYQAQVAQNNARIANLNAGYAARAGQQKEQSEAWKVRGLLGRQAAAQAAGGLDVNSGSALDLRDSTAALGLRGVAEARDRAAQDYYGYKAQQTDALNQAALARASEPTVLSSLLSAAQAVGRSYNALRSPASKAFAATAGAGEAKALAGELGGSEPEDFRDPDNWVFI